MLDKGRIMDKEVKFIKRRGKYDEKTGK